MNRSLDCAAVHVVKGVRCSRVGFVIQFCNHVRRRPYWLTGQMFSAQNLHEKGSVL